MAKKAFPTPRRRATRTRTAHSVATTPQISGVTGAFGAHTVEPPRIHIDAPKGELGFTGERYTSGVEGVIQYEHYHRYLFALPFCAGKVVLDIASGEGYGSNILAGVARTVIGVDVDREVVDAARRAFNRPNLEYRVGSATRIPLPDESVEVIVSYETLEHIYEHDEFLKECTRVLRPNGTFIISTPDTEVFSPPGSPPNQFHVRELTRAQFEALIARHFDEYTILGQAPIVGSVIAGDTTEGASLEYLQELEPRTYAFQPELRRPTYLIAVAGAKVPESVNLLNGAVSAMADYQNLNDRVSTFEQDVVRLNHEVILRDTEITRLVSIESELLGKLNASESLSEITAALNSELTDLRCEASLREAELVRLREDKRDLSEKLKEAEERLFETKAVLEYHAPFEAEVVRLNHEVLQRDAEIVRLVEVESVLNSELTDLVREASLRETELVCLREDKCDLSEKLKEAEERLFETKAALEYHAPFEAEVVRLNHEVLQRDAEIWRLAEVESVSHEGAVASQAEREVLTGALEVARANLAATQAAKVLLEADVSQRDQEIDRLARTNEALRAQALADAQRAAEANADLSLNAARTEALRTAFDDRISKISRQTADLDAELLAVQTQLRLQLEIESANALARAAEAARFAETEREAERLRVMLVQAEAKVAREQEERAKLQQRCAECEQEVERASQRLAENEAAMSRAHDERSELERHAHALQRMRDQGGEHVRSLESQLEHAQAEYLRACATIAEIRSSTVWKLARVFAHTASAVPRPIRRRARGVLGWISRGFRGGVRIAPAQGTTPFESPSRAPLQTPTAAQPQNDSGGRVQALEQAQRLLQAEVERLRIEKAEILDSSTWKIANAAVRAAKVFPDSARNGVGKLLGTSTKTPQANTNVAVQVQAEERRAAPTTATKCNLTIILAPPSAPSASTMAALQLAAVSGAEVFVLAEFQSGFEDLFFLGAVHADDVVAQIDRLVRSAEHATALVVTCDAAPAEDAGLACARVLNERRVVAANGVLLPRGETWSEALASANGRATPMHQHMSANPTGMLTTGLLCFDVDAFVHLGGLDGGPDSLVGALMRFSVRARDRGFDVVIAPMIAAHTSNNTAVVQLSRRGGALAPRPKALLCDLLTPTPDRDAASIDTIWHIKFLHEMGYDVTFMATHERGYAGRYTDELRAMGVSCPVLPDYPEPWQLLRDEGAAFDLIILYRVSAACHVIGPAREFAQKAKIIFWTVDLHFLRELRAAELSNSSEAMAQAEATRREELRVIAQADATTVISPYELELLQRLTPSATVHHFPIARPVPGLLAPLAGRSGMMFVGGFAHQPNVDAAIWLCQDIWPRVRALAPDTVLHLIGSKAPAEVVALHDPANGIDVVGFEPSLVEWYRRVRVNLAPLRFGGGIKGKIVSSMAAGIPTVTTSIGAEGVGVENGCEVFVADDAQSFAEAAVRLLRDDALWTETSRNSVEAARAAFSVEVARRKMHDLLRDLGLPN